MNKLLNFKAFFVIVFFFIIFLVGFLLAKDYGLAIDEWDLKRLGYVNYNYIIDFFNIKKATYSNQPNLLEYKGNTHGPIFVVLLTFLERLFNIQEVSSVYYFRHFATNFIFCISVFYFYNIVKEKFNSWEIGIIGAIFLYLSPRIFAESFYNYKDILFLSLTIINLHYGIKFLKSNNIINTIIFAVSASIATNIRIIGLLLPFVICFVYFIENLRQKRKDYKPLLFVSILIIIFTYFFWPYLWLEPFNRLVEIFVSLGKYDWRGYNLYLGDYISAKYLPWHYPFLWIIITIPIFYLSLFFIGFLNYLIRVKKRLFKISQDNNDLNDLWRGPKEMQDFIFLIYLILPFFIVLVFNSTLYNGWRHFYFLYPFIILFSLNGLYFIKLKLFKKKNNLFLFLVFLFISQIGFTIFKYHPHQNIYFNVLAGKNINQKFEVDYFGISNKQAIEKILFEDKRKQIKISTRSQISLKNSIDIFQNKVKKRIIITSLKKSDYIIDNQVFWNKKKKKKKMMIPANYKLFYEKKIDETVVYSIYKKQNL